VSQVPVIPVCDKCHGRYVLSDDRIETGMSGYAARIGIALFALCWFYAIARLITRGWREVSKYYLLTGLYTGKKYYFRTGSFAGANYGCLLIIGGNHRGMYLSALMPSHLCPPLLIPWDDITAIERRGLLTREVELRFVHDYERSDTYNYISRRLAVRLEAASGGRWTYMSAGKGVIFGNDEYR
jgi:hypothetical protein